MKRWKKIINKRIFIIAILFISGFTFSSCNNLSKDNNSFIDNSFFDGKYNISALDFFLKEDDFYYIYYYSRTCPQCDYLKERISNFIANSDNKIYTLSLENISSNEFNMFKEVDTLKTNEEMKNEMINVSKINDVYLIGYPSLYLIDTNYQNNEKYLKDVILGNRKINEYLDSINF